MAFDFAIVNHMEFCQTTLGVPVLTLPSRKKPIIFTVPSTASIKLASINCLQVL